MVHTMLKRKNIINVGILGSKITGGTFPVNVFRMIFCFQKVLRIRSAVDAGARVIWRHCKGKFT